MILLAASARDTGCSKTRAEDLSHLGSRQHIKVHQVLDCVSEMLPEAVRSLAHEISCSRICVVVAWSAWPAAFTCLVPRYVCKQRNERDSDVNSGEVKQDTTN